MNNERKSKSVKVREYDILKKLTSGQVEPGTRNPERGTRNPERGTRNPERGTRNAERGTFELMN